MSFDLNTSYQNHAPMVLRQCRRLLTNEADALDAMQETFARVLERKDTLDGSAPGALLWRVATNVCLNMIRAQKNTVTEQDLLYHIACLDHTDDQVMARSTLQRIFGRQKESTRVMAVMFWLEGYTYEEIAVELDMSVSGVRKRLRQLKQALERRGIQP